MDFSTFCIHDSWRWYESGDMRQEKHECKYYMGEAEGVRPLLLVAMLRLFLCFRQGGYEGLPQVGSGSRHPLTAPSFLAWIERRHVQGYFIH